MHRERSDEITRLSDETRKSVAFGSDNESCRPPEIDFGIRFRVFCRHIQPGQPDAVFLERLHGARQVYDARDLQMFGSSRRRAHGGRGDAGRPVFRKDHPRHTGGIRRP